MSINGWDPFRNIATLQNRINRLFDDAFPRAGEDGENLSLNAWHPLVDIFEADDSVMIKVDLPGVKKQDVSIEVKENVLTIKGERKSDTSVSDNRYYRKERAFGAFQRTFAMQTEVAPESIKATFKDGVLNIEVPKPNMESPKQISVDIE